jgi:hypothetical protein
MAAANRSPGATKSHHLFTAHRPARYMSWRTRPWRALGGVDATTGPAMRFVPLGFRTTLFSGALNGLAACSQSRVNDSRAPGFGTPGAQKPQNC